MLLNSLRVGSHSGHCVLTCVLPSVWSGSQEVMELMKGPPGQTMSCEDWWKERGVFDLEEKVMVEVTAAF